MFLANERIFFIQLFENRIDKVLRAFLTVFHFFYFKMELEKRMLQLHYILHFIIE